MSTNEEKAQRAAYMREYTRRNGDRIKAQRAARYAKNPGPTRERNARRQRQQREAVQAYGREYYRRHSESIRARSAKWAADHAEQRRIRNAEWLAKNLEKMRAYWRDYYQKNRERVAQYCQQNKERFAPRLRDTQHRRRARQRQASVVPFTMTALADRLSMYGDRCWMCGADADHVDHVIPISKGGPHVLANLRPACGPCNRRKGNRDWRLFA